jgi:peptidyl-prolyl cis-trans isomerase C
VSRNTLRSLIVFVPIAVALTYGGYRIGVTSGGVGLLDPLRFDGPQVARYGGRALHLSELQARVDALPEPLRARLNDAAAREEFVREMVKLEVLARAAEEKGYHRDPEFVRRYAQELGQIFVRRQIEETYKEPTDEDLRAYMESHESEFKRPERVRIAVVSFLAKDASERAKKRELASAALSEARATAKDYYAFGRIVRERSEDVHTRGQNGQLPPSSRDELVATLGPEAADAAFAMKEAGQVADRVVETEGGFHVLKLLGRDPAYEARLEDVREPLRARLTAQSRAGTAEKLTADIWKRADLQIDQEALKQLQTSGKATAAVGQQ